MLTNTRRECIPAAHGLGQHVCLVHQALPCRALGVAEWNSYIVGTSSVRQGAVGARANTDGTH